MNIVFYKLENKARCCFKMSRMTKVLKNETYSYGGYPV